MKKTFLVLSTFLVLCGLSLASEANFNGGVAGGAVAFNTGFYNPVIFGGGPGVGNLWGGGYNLNSLSGGGWGGFPAGYGFGPIYPPYASVGGGIPGGFGGGAPCSGALTGGFGGYYSPFVGGF
jgi:hypothetical protein